MEKRVNGIAKPPVPAMTDDQLIGMAMKKLTRAQVLLKGDDSDGLQGFVVRRC